MNSDLLRATLPGRLAYLANKKPESTALREKRFGVWQEYSWLQYWEAAQAVGHRLWELGIRSGDHTAILANNRTEWLFADLGAQGLGARSVGVYETSPPEDVAYIVNHSEAKILFCEDQEQVDKALEILDSTPKLEHIVVFDPRGTRKYDAAKLESWDDFLARGHELRRKTPGFFLERVQEMDADAPCMVVYTSGTTGTPKGALLSSRNVTSGGDATAEVIGARESDTLLSYLPLCHVAEKIFTFFQPLALGNVVHFGESIATVQADLREVSPTVFLGVPRIWEKIHASVTIKMRDSSWLKRKLFAFAVARGGELARRRLMGTVRWVDWLGYALADVLILRALQERLGLRNCRLPVSGAAPISIELLEWFRAIGVPILEGYGMTECGGGSHFNPPEAPRLGTVGKALPHMECKTADDGEVLLYGPNVFKGYLHNEEATRQVIDDAGWLHTGDIGRIDDAGYLHITGRKKEIIITSGGKNISPEKIENALKMSPYIKEAVAIGDNRKYVGALIQIEYDTVGDWATRRKIPYTSYGDLAAKDEVQKLVSAEVHRCNEPLLQVERVKTFRIFPKELHQDDGELTATQKVRRRAITDTYGTLIESMYKRGVVSEAEAPIR